MATFKIYKLHFTSPLHISDQREDSSVSLKSVCSDTLYAALISCMAKYGNRVPQDGDLGFTLSSLFPYFQEKPESVPVYFLPMPFQARLPELKDVSKAKTVKKVQWVDASLYGKVLAGDSFFDGTDEYFGNIYDSYLVAPDTMLSVNFGEFVKSEISQRVTLNSRIGEEDAKPYYVDRVLFKYYSGLYFLAVGDTESLEKALKYLSIEGIGTDRNLGFGLFGYSVDQMELNVPQDADHLLSLSAFIPAKDELEPLLDSGDVAYDFVRRGGWITTHPYMTLRKNAVYAFLSGSVFRKPVGCDTLCMGKIVDLAPSIGDLSPSHPVWRNGKSIMLPIKLKK